MMHPERMTTLSLLVPKKYGKKVIQKLHDMQIYHIQNHQKGTLDIGTPFPEAQEIAGALIKSKSVCASLGEGETKKQSLQDLSHQEIISKVEELATSFSHIQNAERELQEALAHAQEQQKLNVILTSLDVQPELLQKESKHLSHFFGYTQQPIEEPLKKDKIRYALKEFVTKEKKGILLFVPQEEKEKVQEILSQTHYEEYPFVALKKTKSLEELQKQHQQVLKQKETFQNQHGSFLQAAKEHLQKLQEQAEAPLLFGTSAYTLLIQGWVPTKKVRKVCAELHDLTKGNLFIEEKAATEKEIPILLENKKIWKPFEFFLELFALPNYKELDPTFLLFLTFPIFFGIMLGDVGYGLVTLFFFLFLRKKIPSLKPLLTVMIYSSLITILFGALYGEYFGFEHLGEEKGQALCAATGICLPRIMEVAEHGELAVEYIYDFPRALNRLHGHINVLGTELLSVLFIGALLGVLHVNLGLLLGFYNTWKAHGFKHALLEKGSWWVLQLGIVLLVLGYLQIGFQPWVGGIIMILAAVMLYLGEGITGIIELPSIFSNMLSYMRLGAVGLASVGLAVVINENLTMPLIEQGGIFVLLGILIFVIGHIINIALGVIGPFLHSLRLHYVEFFTKFYKGGGIAFQPFGKKI